MFDAGQAFVAQFFDNLLIKFGKFQTENFISKIFIQNNTKKIKGLYLYGGVGRGKSMMMDLFFHQVQIKEKRRLHFHDFMKEVHQRILEKRKTEEKKNTVSF